MILSDLETKGLARLLWLEHHAAQDIVYGGSEYMPMILRESSSSIQELEAKMLRQKHFHTGKYKIIPYLWILNY